MAAEPVTASAGEIAGYASAIVLLLGSFGAAVRWLFGRADRREALVSAREAELVKKLEARLDRLETDHEKLRSDHATLAQSNAELSADHATLAQSNAKLRAVVLILADEVATSNPSSRALAQARHILGMAFPMPTSTPVDMLAMLESIGGRTARSAPTGDPE